MSKSWIIENGRIIDPASGRDEIASLVVTQGYIAPAEEPAPADAERINARGCWIAPGLIDMHTHLREPGEEYKEDILSGARAAAAGGFTGIACMPNTTPVNDCAAITNFILDQARQAAVRVYPIGAISRNSQGELLADLGELKNAGVVAVSDDGRPVANSQLMRRALEYASDFNLPVISHCEDVFLGKGVMHEGPVATRLGLRGIPAAAEAVMVYRDIALAEWTEKPVHIAHVSTAQSLDLIRAAKARGVRVTAETAPHYFILTDEDVADYDTNAKMNPPLRSKADREAVRQALIDGTLDAIATDHAPHSTLEKDCEFDLAANGIIGLESALPLSLSLVADGIISPMRLVELLALNPAKILGLSAGTLQHGALADLTIIKADQPFIFSETDIYSKSRNTPFLGRQLPGRTVLTMVGGEVRFEKGLL
ncbi:MAG: dihydroorotase [Desulfobulbaceae bacterium]|nr:dihydroorotase [Desulfobulbaceae bacterium]